LKLAFPNVKPDPKKLEIVIFRDTENIKFLEFVFAIINDLYLTV